MLSIAMMLAISVSAAAPEDVVPSYSRSGFDFFSAPIEAPKTRTAAHTCAKQFGKHTEVRAIEEGDFLCSVPTPSEPRLSSRLRDEIDLIGDVTELKREKVVASLIDKYKRLAQCPAGTQPAYDGAMYFCQRTYTAKELCANGTPNSEASDEIGCLVSTCPKGLTDLSALTAGKHPGCFKCPKGTWDAKETEAFHGALKGMPVDYTEVFCKAKAGGATAEK